MDESTERRSRRQLLVGGLAAAAGLALGRLGRPDPVAAANGDTVTVGNSFTGDEATTITNTASAANEYAIVGVGTGLTNGVRGVSTNGAGVEGASTTSAGVFGSSNEWSGVYGKTAGQAGAGVLGTSGTVALPAETELDSGVAGISASGTPLSTGVYGESGSGVGMYGFGPTGVVGDGDWGVYGTGGVGVAGDVGVGGTGVYGFVGSADAPIPTANVGVEARAGSTAQLALNVVGRAKFSRSGRTLIGAGKSFITISLTGVTSSSLVFANLYTYRAGTYVISATPVTGSFTIRLNRALASSAYVVWFVLN